MTALVLGNLLEALSDRFEYYIVNDIHPWVCSTHLNNNFFQASKGPLLIF